MIVHRFWIAMVVPLPSCGVARGGLVYLSQTRYVSARATAYSAVEFQLDSSRP